MLKVIKSLNRTQKRSVMLVLDLALMPLALLFTFAVQVNTLTPIEGLAGMAPVLPYLVAAAAAISWALGIPQIRLNAYEIRAMGKTALFALYLTATSAVLSRVAGLGLPLGLHVVFGLTFFLLSAAARVVLLQLLMALYRREQPRCRVLIYGAGSTGSQLAQAFAAHESIDPVAFVDDNTALHGLTVAGLPVYTPVDIAKLARDHRVNRVLLAIPSASLPKQAQIARGLEKMGLEVQTLPSFSQLIGEEELVDKLTPISPGTFLRRRRLDDRIRIGCEAYARKVVLISGAGGSIGSELSRQVLSCRPKKLVLYELSELALYTVDTELRPLAEDQGIELIAVLGSVTDPRQVRKVLADHKPGVILHAAAYKHVPLVEQNPLAGLANNVFGAQTLAREAAAHGVERFILVSTDKAVRPTNVMGASKRLAELVIQDLATRETGTVFAMVRFGNVLGSSGSVVPLFQEQIARGGPVTVTHAEVTRFFMTVQEAVQLVLRAGSLAEGGEVYVLDMGKPVPIMQLARQVIERSGYAVYDDENPDGDIEIVITGLRPGEKLHEELLLGEGAISTRDEKIFVAREDKLSEIEVAAALRALRAAAAAGDEAAARAVISRWVEGYAPPAVAASDR